MKRILCLSLTGIHNFGEEIIEHTVKYLCETIGNCQVLSKQIEPEMGLFRMICYYILILFSKHNPKGRISAALVKMAVSIRCKSYYENMIKDIDAIILACGSFKYGTQKLWAYYSLVIEVASQRNIPVIFNAMNQQKYDRNDWRCRWLEKHANYPNVKIITTRDGDEGIKRLRIDYGINEAIICEEVGDPALWITEAYGIQKRDTDFVGINLITANVFKRYGTDYSEEKLLYLYLKLLQRLDELEIKWKLFTNGLPVDYEFGKKILRKYGKKKSIIIPSSDHELLDIVASCKIIFGARLHTCICSFALQIPVVGFCWDEKILRFAEIMGVEEFFLKTDELEIDAVWSRFERIFDGNYCFDTVKMDFWKKKTKNYIEMYIDSI